jgi:hypothetical protein
MGPGRQQPGSLGPAHGSPQWTDNVARMHLFMEKHPEVEITTPRQNGTDDFIARWPDGELRDRSLGPLMTTVEGRFGSR